MELEKSTLAAYALFCLRMISVWNAVGECLLVPKDMQERMALAGQLEQCLYHYKEYWRKNSKEGDLAKISDVFFWYADLLRQGGR